MSAIAKSTIAPINKTEQVHKPVNEKLLQLLTSMDMDMEDLQYFKDLSPYLILDGHRTGIKDSDQNPARGYVEGALFSLRFAHVLKKLGCEKASFLIHTLRNYQTMDRMHAIFSAIEDVGREFISKAYQSNIRLQYFGEGVHTTYALAKIINKAEEITKHCSGFDLNFITNYSEVWGRDHPEEIANIPEISVIGRFTKGHYSGAGIPGHSNKANFIYIQQASVSENWCDEDLVVLALSLLKSHISLNGFVGGKSYKDGEKEAIHNAREELLWEARYNLSKYPRKRIMTYSPKGPLTIIF
ncbi:MAG: undecaprenyl diphosphate synthase family protein [Candidatus Kariarchaeaceae archaeon]|jgi:hypothetical protein